MDNNDFRPHLWIPDGEVEHIENNPTGRSKDRDIDRFEHGSKLSAGLQDIVSAYAKIQSGDSLGGEDLRIFEIVLPEGAKLKDQKDFLADEGITINMVKDERRAIVSTTASLFDKLRRRVDGYRDQTGSTKKFQHIDDFHFRSAKDKQAHSVRDLIERISEDSLRIDVQLLLMPKIDEETRQRAEGTIVTKIKEAKGELMAEPYRLSDGTPIIRAEIPVGAIEMISNDTVVCRVTRTAFFSNTVAAGIIPAQHDLFLDQGVNLEELPIVAVLDDGVDFPKALEPVIVEHWLPSDIKRGGAANHGTNVASKVAFNNVGEQIAVGTMIPRVRIIDCNIRDKDKIPEDVMIKRIREAVATFHESVKVFNLSSTAENPIEGDVISYLGYELDVLSNKYGVKFVIAAGNHELYKTESSLQDILGDDDAKIALPADSMLNISVGAIVGKYHTGSLSREHEVAPYSRIGPGFCGLRKPDMVAYSGTILQSGTTPIDEFSLMLASGGNRWQYLSGTSFAAPIIAGDLAEISRAMPNGNILLSEALLYHGAELPLEIDAKNKLEKDEAKFYGDCFGRGTSVPSVSMYSNGKRVTFVHSGALNRKTKQRVKFHMPKVFEGIKKRNKARVAVTCVTQAPVDFNKGREYLGAYVSASLHKLDKNGNDKCANPKVADCREKWDTCYHFEEYFSDFSGGNWEVWLELFSRWDVDNEQEVEYALAITIEDLTGDGNLDIYNKIQEEAAGRFPALHLVRIPVRR